MEVFFFRLPYLPYKFEGETELLLVADAIVGTWNRFRRYQALPVSCSSPVSLSFCLSISFSVSVCPSVCLSVWVHELQINLLQLAEPRLWISRPLFGLCQAVPLLRKHKIRHSITVQRDANNDAIVGCTGIICTYTYTCALFIFH